MAYSSDVDGWVAFSRPITRREAQPIMRFVQDARGHVFELAEQSDTEEDPETGDVITRTRYVGIRPISGGSDLCGMGYEWEKVLAKMVAALPAGVTAEGEFIATGEDSRQERLTVLPCPARVWKTEPIITWPAPTEGTCVL